MGFVLDRELQCEASARHPNEEASMDHLDEMLQTHPDPAHSDRHVAEACIRACFDCAVACTICADACMAEDDVGDMVACIRLDIDCADICVTTGLLIARPSARDAETLRLQLQSCAAACRACGEECERHGRHGMEHCRVCAEACRACAEACEEMAAALVP